MGTSIFIHESSDVKTKNIGDGTKIWQYCVILTNAIIGRNCNINFNVFIENDVLIGDNVTIKSGVNLWDGIHLGNNVFIGPGVVFTNDLIPRSKQYPLEFLKIKVEDNASIGANSTIIGGLIIGSYSLIGAGSVVTKNIPPFSVWYGNPAKHKAYVTRNGEIVSLNCKDKAGNNYNLINGEPIRI